MKKKKDIGVIIQFDDKEYSREETVFLYQRFFNILAETNNMKIPENILKVIIECILDEYSNR